MSDALEPPHRGPPDADNSSKVVAYIRVERMILVKPARRRLAADDIDLEVGERRHSLGADERLRRRGGREVVREEQQSVSQDPRLSRRFAPQPARRRTDSLRSRVL